MTVLEEFKKLSGTQLIGGELRRSAGTAGFDVIDPATESTLGRIAEATEAEIDQAVGIANQVQKNWARQSGQARCQMCHEIAAKMRAMRPRLAEALTREMGKPYFESAFEVDMAHEFIDYCAEVARHSVGRIAAPMTEGELHFVVSQPLGTVVSVLPFNFPLLLLAWQAGAALAVGNAVIIKPSDLTSLTTLMLHEAFSHLPKGLVQILTGGGAVGARLVEHPDTHGVAFTGRVKTGQAIQRACAESFKRTLIETSGNDPFLVMPSAPLDTAVRAGVWAANVCCGQVCTSAERFYVHEKIYDAFVEKTVERTRAIRIGNGLDKVDLGPMAAMRERERYEAVIRRAVEQGARLACGGGRPAEFNTGAFVQPAVLADCTPDMDILNEESFGPVAPICRVKDFDEAIELANASRYGLGANVYTTDIKEIMRAVDEIQAGTVWINQPLYDNHALPFGGRKLSGIGRECGSEGFEAFSEKKAVYIDPNCVASAWWFPYPDEAAYPRDV